MSLEKQLFEDMKIAMKAGEKLRLETIRGLRAQLKNASIAAGHELSDAEVLQVLAAAAKKRKEAIEQFNAVGRADRADEETQELKVIEAYLPEQLGEAAIQQLIDETIQEVNALSVKDMGKVMGRMMPKVKGKADGKIIQQIVREKLSSL